jgi:hypothetical protein
MVPDSSVLDRVPVAGSCEHGDESSGFIEGGEYLGHVNGYQILKHSDLWCYLVHIFIVIIITKTRRLSSVTNTSKNCPVP